MKVTATEPTYLVRLKKPIARTRKGSVELQENLVAHGRKLTLMTMFAIPGERIGHDASLKLSQQTWAEYFADTEFRKISKELDKLIETATAYLHIKLPEDKAEALLPEVLARVTAEYGGYFKYKKRQLKEQHNDTTIDMTYPLMTEMQYVDMARRAVQVLAGQDVQNLPAMDEVERFILSTEQKLHAMREAFEDKFYHSSFDGRTTVDMPADVQSSYAASVKSFIRFAQSVESVMESANEAWWQTALRMKKGRAITEKDAGLNVAQLDGAIEAAKEEYRAFSEAARTANHGDKANKLDGMAYNHGDDTQGLFPAIDRLRGVVARANLMQEAIAKKAVKEPRK